MKSNVRTALLFVVLLVLTVSSLFAAAPVFTAANITTVPATGTSLVIGSTITITVVDVNNISNPDVMFESATVDMTQFGGPDDLALSKVSNAPGQGQWRANYTIQLGSINAANRSFTVTAKNGTDETTVTGAQRFSVNNIPPMNNSDMTGATYLRVNNTTSTELMKVGDTIHLIATFKPYIASVWVNWGATFIGAPEIEYPVASNGSVAISYTPPSGSLPSSYEADLKVTISKMKSITNGIHGPYFSLGTWSRVISSTQSGFPIAADLNPPSMVGAWDLYYDLNKPLRFSPNATNLDGYNTQPDNFDIYLRMPGWNTLGGPTEFTLRFQTENRLSFEKTYSLLDFPATVTHLINDVLKVTWDGKNQSGQFIFPNEMTTVGITLVGVKDYVGNPALLTQISGNEFPPNGNVLNPSDHAALNGLGMLAHEGNTILNRIHVVLDGKAPVINPQPMLQGQTDPIQNLTLIRLINDANNNGVWDATETINYTYTNGANSGNTVGYNFTANREFTADTNDLRHEELKYWLVVERDGGTPAQKWFWTGGGWAPLSLFDQTMDAIDVNFTGGAFSMTQLVNMNWALGTAPGGIFVGSDTGQKYNTALYLQDNAGNITKATQNVSLTIRDIYMNIPFITGVDVVSEHVTGAGGLPVSTAGIKNFYLTSKYQDADPAYTGPFAPTATYYSTQDQLQIEITVNDRNFLRDTNSVEIRFTQLGTAPLVRYLNKSQFDATNKASITVPVSAITVDKGALGAGQRWKVGGNDGISNYIQVISHSIPYTIGGVPTSQSFNALDEDQFNLVIPPAPNYPDPSAVVYQLQASNPRFSPGNPHYTYDSVSNPANDNVKDDTQISFMIPTGDNMNWALEITDGTTLVRDWTGHLGVGQTPTGTINRLFDGLNNALAPIALPLETKNLTATLKILPEPMDDPGYVAPPANIYPNIPIVVDNTNPKLVNGTGFTVDATTRQLTLAGGVPVVSELDDTLVFTVYSSEALELTGWQVAMIGNNNQPVMNGANPVTATVQSVTQGANNQTFNLVVKINNLAGTLTHERAHLIVKLPWDAAGNPGRYNTPAFPYNGDVFHNDSSEYYLDFNILDAKPRIESITFEHRNVIGEAKYVGENWNAAFDQGYVGPTITGEQTFTITATVSGGAYRAMATNWTADLRPLLGTAAANATVAPTTATAPTGNPNEARVWTLVWNGTIPTAISNAWTHNTILNLPITINTADAASVYGTAHLEVRNINVKVDKQTPTASNSLSVMVADGSAKALNFTVNDPDSGVKFDTESLTLSPNTGMTITKINDGQWTVAIPSNSAVKHFAVTYKVKDRMGNELTYNRYINVDPVPQLTNVVINNNAGYFVPGTDLTVSWNLANAQRATGGQIVLTATPTVAITGGTVNLTAAQLQSGSYTFTNFYNNNTGLDNRTITATVTGYTTGYTAPTAATTANRPFTYGTPASNSDTIMADSKPVITAVSFKRAGAEINTLIPDMDGITIEATVTSINNLDPAQSTITMTTTTGTINGLFNLGTPTITSGTGNTKTITWTNVSFNGLNWTPVAATKVARFNVNTKTVYGYAANPYIHDMAVMKNPDTIVQGKVGSRAAYTGTDPNGWFAPEHFVHTEYNFVTTVNQTTYPPIEADFDLIEDHIVDNWRQPQAIGSGSTRTPINVTLNRNGSNITVTVYQYNAKWVIQPDVQSVWNAYNDGQAVPIGFKYTQMTGTVSDSYSIKVDKSVPKYDGYLWIATGTTTPGAYQPYHNGFPGASPDITLALNPGGVWPAGQKVYLKYTAKDIGGVGVMDVPNPTVSAGWTVAQVSHTIIPAGTEEYGTVEKVISLTPTNPNNVQANSSFTITFGRVQDAVGHVNYGTPVNSTDPDWTNVAPTQKFVFRADYVTSHQMLRGFKYLGSDRQDYTTAPFVQAGAPMGVMLELAPIDQRLRGVDVQDITVSGVQLNTRYITNVSGGTDNWVTLVKDPVTDIYYLNSNYNVNVNYAHGANIPLQYRINYLITYTDGTTSVPPAYVSAMLNNIAKVDKQAPTFIYDGDPINPANQRSVFYWSETIGSGQEGYVVPGDMDGQMRVIFKDDSGYEATGTVPNVVIGGLDEFVIGMPASYTVAASELTHHANYSLNVRNTTYNYTDVWVAAISDMQIKAKTTAPLTSATITYSITDVVGNGPLAGNRMVEIAANGPIVPIIREARVASVVPGTGDTVYNYLAPGVPATMQVFIDAEYAAYIENVWIDPITGVSYGAPTAPVLVNAATHNVNNISHDLWMVNIALTPANINSYNNITFVVHTKRNPFGAPLFTGTYNVPVIVDGKGYNYDSSVITGISSFGTYNGMLGPNADATIVATFPNIGELVVVNGDQSLSSVTNIEDWFTLQNATPQAFVNIPAPTIQIVGDDLEDVIATWTFDSSDINQALAAGVNQLSFTLKYQNIWGLNKTTAPISFNFDQIAPVITNIEFYEAGAVAQTDTYDAANYIANNQNWDKIRFNLNDPNLRVGVPGSGIEDIQVTFTREAETYTPNPDPILNMTGSYNAAGNYYEIEFNPGFHAFDLAEGFYNFAIYTTDGLDNDVLYTQRLLYWHHPSQMEIVPAHNSDVHVLKADGTINNLKVTAFPGDATGQVQAVQFFLYEDVNNNGIYEAAIDIDRTADLTNEAGGAIDHQAPYTVMWNFDAPHYKYLENAVYNRDASRQFLLRASVLSEGSRAVTDSIVVINVIDNQPPVPNVPTVAGNQIFNYIDTTQNKLNLNVSFDAQWVDADVATFVITKADGTPVTTIDANVTGFVANAVWDYNGQLPGEFLFSVIGKDVVGNVSAAVAAAAPVSIQNPASLISYSMIMSDVQGFNDATPISNGTIYGANNPVEAVGSLRLETEFFINDPLHPLHGTPSLEGVQAVTFKARVTNNVTGAVSVIDLVNDIALQPDYPATGAIPVDPQIINNTVTLFIPDNFYMVAGYDTQDISYEFFVELTPIHPAVLQDPVYTGIRLDYYAPVVTIAEATPYITWSKANEFKITGDIVEVQTIAMKWSKDNTNWLDAQDINYAVLPYTVNLDPSDTYIKFANWNTAGGSVESLLDYEGAVWVKVIAEDALGNVRESAVVQLHVDNVAPETPVTHVAYRTHPDVEAATTAGAYSTLHALGTLAGEVNNTITMVTSTQGDYGTSSLRIYVDPAQITGLSTTALGNTYAWNEMASWYTGTNDFRPPLRLYHGYSATGDVNNITWISGAMYDHEQWDGMYGFDIPIRHIKDQGNQGVGTHYFIVAANDTRGNVEGDFADGLQAFDGLLDPTERIAAIDLTVNVINIADVQMEVVYPLNNAIVGEWLNLAANITSNAAGVDVNNVVFQRKVGASWVDMATVANSNSANLNFHLYRKDIPQYDGLPYVPGVHLYANGAEVGELTWNATTQSWHALFPFNLGSYNFEYYLDLNNDGIISNLDSNIAAHLGNTSMHKIQDPNGFTNFTVTPWVYSFNSETITDGLYEFRVVPIDANNVALFNHVSPSTWLHIDNTAPNTVIESVGGIQRIRVAHDPNNVNINYELVRLAADVNELLVAYDDIIDVTYQYSPQVPNAPIRRWVDFDSSNTMSGNYMVDFAVGLAGGILAPINDNVDNDNDGLVDEADEAETSYYLRAVARDKAGNYFTSNVIEIEVDGQAPIMQVREINGQLMADTQNIFTIPVNGEVEITAIDITSADFDGATHAYFEYIFRPSMDNSYAWSSPQVFDVNNIWLPVVNGRVSQILPASKVEEGYYGFRAVARDILRNEDVASTPYTYVVFDDAFGSHAHIVSLGSDPQNGNLPVPVISDEYAFAQSAAYYNGTINISIDNPTEINTITARWAENVNGPWTNINTVAVNNQSLISIPWTTPILTRAPYIYLQISAQDIYANTESSEIVKLYVDTMAPGADVSLNYNDAEGKKAIDIDNDLNITLNYTNLNNDGILDVNYVRINLRDENDVIQQHAIWNYAGVAQADTNFLFTALNLAGLADGIYHLELVLRDFAGNEAIILPADYQALYIDTTAPAALSIASTNFPGSVAPYNQTIAFRVDYTDLIGVSATDAFSAVFSYQGVSQTVNTYTLDSDTNGTWIEFNWLPSTDFQQIFLQGAMEINVAVNAEVKDLLGNTNTVAENFKLTYGVPNTTRIMVVTDYAYDLANAMIAPRDNLVNWNMATPQVVAQIGTNQNTPMPLDLYAYVAHQSEIPAQVDFEWLDESVSPAVWMPIGSQTVGNQWNFVHNQFLAAYQREYQMAWDISGMATGDYQVRTRSHHAAGISESTITLHIYNGNITPSFAIDGIVNGEVERGETYTLSVANFVGDDTKVQGVRYKYRYVDDNNSPTSEWMFFGHSNGSFNDAWIQGDYSFDWTVYPFYLFNNRVQIIAYAMDFWGTETPIAEALTSTQYANIVNRLAPSVSGIKLDWVAAANTNAFENEVIVKATINSSSAPSDLVNVEFLHKLNGASDFSSFDTQSGWTQAQMTTDLALVSAPFTFDSATLANTGEIKVLTTDVFGNTNEAVFDIANLPVAAFAITEDGETITNKLERESTVVLDAAPNAAIVEALYYWDTLPGAATGPVWIATANAAPYTLDWDVPANWTFGDHYQLLAKVNDADGNSFTHVRSFEITDHTTDIVIDTVAGIAPTTIGIINGRLHGNIPVVITVNDVAIPRVEFMIRANTENADWESVAFVNVVAPNLTYVYDELDALPSGQYYIGVRAAARNMYPVISDQVLVTIDNEIAITVDSYLPETDGFFNGNDFIVNFTVANEDEINETNVTLQYNTAIEPTWMGGSIATLTTTDGIHYTATFANVGVPVDGYYNFRFIVADMAIPAANSVELPLAQHVLVDTGLPIVNMVSINGETDLTLPLDIELGTQVNIAASAYDVQGGQIHLIASGMDKVEFLIDGTVMAEIVDGQRSREVYSFVWNTLGYEINTSHSVQAIAYDKAGNTAATMNFVVNLVAPVGLEAFAMITAMDFDATTANQDHIYAVVKDWPATGATPAVTFEYFNGTAWSHFANGIDFGTYYRAVFNAELMANATALRAVVNGNYNAPMPEVAVSYNAADASLVVVDPAISADIFYKNELRITESFAGTPIVTALQGAAPLISEPYMMNGNQVVDIDITTAGTHSFWAAVLNNNGNVELTKTVVETVNAGIASDNGISFSVPAGGFGYFQNVAPAMALPEGFTALSPQHAFFAKDNAGILVNRDLTISISTPAAEGDLVAMYYDVNAGTWSAPMPVINNNDGTVNVAGVPAGTVVSVMQYTGVGIHAMFHSIDPVYVVTNTLWTTNAPTIEFFIYEGLDANGYILPLTLSNLTLYLDEVAVAPTAAYDPATGLVGYSATGLEAGAHTMRLVVEQNGFTAIATQNFFVEITAPEIVATGSQITSTLRALTATITDAETGIKNVDLRINNMLNIPMNLLTVSGNNYSYNLTDEDLFYLGYTFTDVMDLSVRWVATNNLDMASPATVVNYTVNITGPGIVFTGFDNGWWINPTHNTPLTFNVIAPAGRVINDNLMVTLEEMINDPINGNYVNLIQNMEINPVSVTGQTYSYSVNFGYLVAPNAHAIRLGVIATDNYDVTSSSEQTYGIDYLAPIVWAVSPVGAPINPAAFPVTYESAVIPYGTPVSIAVGFQDMQGFIAQESGEWIWISADNAWHQDYLLYYTGASGIDTANVKVSLDGTLITGTITNGSFTYTAPNLAPGLHTVVATVADKAGNVGSLAYTFTITGGTPSITFNGVNGNANEYWINSTNNNALGFTVNTVAGVAIETVVANIYAEPGDFIIQGPITPALVNNAYSVNLLGGIVPAGQFAVRMEVTATTVLGVSATSTQTYGIDNDAPVITLTSPAENSVFAPEALVNILAQITDQVAAKSGAFTQSRSLRSDDKAGSGLQSIKLSVYSPTGTDLMDGVTIPVAQVVAQSLSGAATSELGTYNLVLIATDKAGNQSMITRSFMVVPTTGPTVSFADHTGWLIANGNNHLAFTVAGEGILTVSAKVFGNPSDALLMGPLAVQPVSGVYTVSVNGNMIPADQHSIRLEVTVNDMFGNVSVANYYYNVDKVAPTISILSPVEGAQITRVDANTAVNIEAQFADLMLGENAVTGSGIASSRLVVIGPDGVQIGAAVDTGAGIATTSHQLTGLELGNHTVRITVLDNAGNQAVATVNFIVVDVPAPPVELDITEAHIFPNPSDADTGARFSISVNTGSTVSVRIYDFAGREVRTMNYAAKSNGKAVVNVHFDGRNNDGVKLARGSYFARVIANDGTKTVEKVVKIAIRK